MDEISKAIKLLSDNDYLIIKMVQTMKDDADECAEMFGGMTDKDCSECSLCGCFLQG